MRNIYIELKNFEMLIKLSKFLAKMVNNIYIYK